MNTPHAAGQARLRVWQLAWPMILSNLTTPLLGLVDTAVTGHLDSPDYLGAVALASLIFSFLYWGFGFLRMGTSGLTAQALGAQQHQLARMTLARSLLLALVIACSILLASPLLELLAFHLLEADQRVEQLAQLYFAIRIWSAPATLANYALLGWFIGMQNSRIPLAVSMLANLCNIFLDWLFVVHWQWEVTGLAVASVIAEYIALAFGLWQAQRMLNPLPAQLQWSELLQTQPLVRMLKVNSNIFIRTLCLISVFALFTSRGAGMGEVILASNALLMNFQSFMAFALDGFAHAAEALIGKAHGAASKGSLRHYWKASLLWSLLVALGFALLYAIAGNRIIGLLTDLPSVRQTAAECLPWIVLTPLISVWSFLYDGIFIGTTRTREMRDGMLIATFCVFLPTLWLLQPLGIHGLWLSFLLFMAVRGSLLVWWYHCHPPHPQAE